jgi:hypothetical protein
MNQATLNVRVSLGPGRPKKIASGHRTGPMETNASSGEAPAPEALIPRLLDLGMAASYLSVSPWTVRDLEAAGVLSRVRVPLPGGRELRKLLFDKADLDRVIGVWKGTAV